MLGGYVNMRKTMSLVLSLTFISTILWGCQSGDSTTIDTDKTKPEQQSEEENEKLNFDREITKVSISKAQGNIITVFDDEKSIETFKSIISSAVNENGIVNIVNPEYYMDVVYANKNKQSFELWIGEKGEKSALMKTNNTYTLYTVSKEMTDKLIDLIE